MVEARTQLPLDLTDGRGTSSDQTVEMGKGRRMGSDRTTEEVGRARGDRVGVVRCDREGAGRGLPPPASIEPAIV